MCASDPPAHTRRAARDVTRAVVDMLGRHYELLQHH